MCTDLTFLVKRSKQGDADAFAELYDVYKESLFRCALYMLGSPDDAEDAVQEAVFSAWRNIKSLKDDSLFKAWLFKILKNRCKTILAENKKGTEALPVEDYEFLLSDEHSEDHVLSVELLQLLKELTPPDGQIIILSVLGGFKSHELAAIFNMPAGTIRSRQKRALEKMRAALS